MSYLTDYRELQQLVGHVYGAFQHLHALAKQGINTEDMDNYHKIKMSAEKYMALLNTDWQRIQSHSLPEDVTAKMENVGEDNKDNHVVVFDFTNCN